MLGEGLIEEGPGGQSFSSHPPLPAAAALRHELRNLLQHLGSIVRNPYDPVLTRPVVFLPGRRKVVRADADGLNAHAVRQIAGS
jgi:hypothetical protein